MHVFRLEVARLVLNAGKHCLLEKPMALSHTDGLELKELAEEKGLFLTEGMWTRYFPAVEHARELIANGEIGDVTCVSSDFHFHSPSQEVYPTSPLYNRRLAGGAGYYLASYPVAAALACFKQWPDRVMAIANVDEGTEVDVQGCIQLGFPRDSNGGGKGGEENNLESKGR